jgi:hypothetical protein
MLVDIGRTVVEIMAPGRLGARGNTDNWFLPPTINDPVFCIDCATFVC